MSVLRPYQYVGAKFLRDRKRALLGDDMGLGKTPQAACALIDVLAKLAGDRALVICPANIRINWQRELAIWCPHLTSSIVEGDKFPRMYDVVIISYNALKRWHDLLRAEIWGVVIADEAHYMKTLDSQRTIQVRGGFGTSPIPCRVKWALTGTPLTNRPIELYPILKWLGAPWVTKEAQFGNRYCGGYVREFKGATHLPELRKNLKGIMLRRLKSEVLKDLPPKTREVIELELGDAGKAAIAEEKNALREAGMTFESIIERMEQPNLKFAEQGVIARLRKNAGILKIEAATEHILDVLDSVDKVIVFAQHKDVIAALETRIASAFHDSFLVLLVGSSSQQDRQYAIDQFQKNPKCRVFIGNLHAAGVGITLTAASHIIFVERDWTPGVNTQCEDRAHRYGQTRGVLVQHLVLSGSLDSYMARSVIAKQVVLDAILN